MEIILLMIIVVVILFYIMSSSAANIMMIMKYGSDWDDKQTKNKDNIPFLLAIPIFIITLFFEFLAYIYKALRTQKYLTFFIAVLLIGIGINMA